jgi:hypothetical protein
MSEKAPRPSRRVSPQVLPRAGTRLWAPEHSEVPNSQRRKLSLALWQSTTVQVNIAHDWRAAGVDPSTATSGLPMCPQMTEHVCYPGSKRYGSYDNDHTMMCRCPSCARCMIAPLTGGLGAVRTAAYAQIPTLAVSGVRPYYSRIVALTTAFIGARVGRLVVGNLQSKARCSACDSYWLREYNFNSRASLCNRRVLVTGSRAELDPPLSPTCASVSLAFSCSPRC